MSSPSWRAQLKAVLNRLRRAESTPRITILGIGNEFRGDDAAGVRIVRQLSARIAEKEQPGLLLLEAGIAPENFSGPLRKFSPHLVLLVDAARMGLQPGEIRWLDWREAEGISSSTHTLPPSVLAQYLVNELNCAVVLLGIQPETLDFDEPVTPAVEAAINAVAEELAKNLS